MWFFWISIAGPIALSLIVWLITKHVDDDPEMAEIKRADGILPKDQPEKPDYARIAELERSELGIGVEAESEPSLVEDAARRALVLGMPLPTYEELPVVRMGCPCESCQARKHYPPKR